MKNYTITVNGTVYDVTVEEGGAGSAPVRAAAPKAAPKAAPAAAPAPAKEAAPAGGGSIEVTASVPGKVFKVEAKVGQSVNAGDTIVILEAMKMEIPVVAPEAGTVASIDVAVGDAVESGDILATMN
ncbi:MAG: biotin/lipoyl-binding carrier protein [Lachnospiraceae bacterium]|nr:biotin/lipoyl-binding carrier protein [Lachnospiraceae bacterium]